MVVLVNMLALVVAFREELDKELKLKLTIILSIVIILKVGVGLIV
jgi:hypothetical protein